MLRHTNIYNRLALALLSVALLVFVLAGVGLVLFQSLTLEHRARQMMEPYAQLVAVGTDTAVAFEDPVRAQEIIDTLRGNSQILEADIFLNDGRLLASFSRMDNTGPRRPSTKLDGVYLSGDTAELLQGLPGRARLRLTMGLDQLTQQTRQVMWLFGAGVLVLLTVTLAQLAILRRTVVRPIASLTEATELVRARADYQHRVPAVGTDEVGRLGQSFNAMMAAIQEREDDLRRLTLLQRTILDNVAYGIVSTTPDGTITSFNSAAERLLGYTADELVGKQTPALWHDAEEIARYSVTLFEELGETISPGFDVFATRPRRNLAEENEWTFIRKDGTRVPVLLSVSALRDGSGQITGFVGLAYDLTERKRVEDALLFVAQRGWQTGAENFFDALAQFLGEKLDMDYVLIDKVDEDPEMAETVALYAKGAITPNMRYALKGTPCENVMGRRLCVYPQGIQQLFPEDTLLPGMGAESYTGIPLWDSKGRPIGLIAVMGTKPLPDDAPVAQLLQLVATRAAAELERKRADEEIRTLNQELEQRVADRTAELKSANKELEAFSYSVSHDLRAPLRHIDGFLDLLKERIGPALDEESRRYMTVISEAAFRMGTLIDDLLSFSRMGRAEMARSQVDLGVLAQEVIDELEPETKGRVIHWRITDLPVVTGDRAMLRVALVNLISNALKFTQPRAQAEIEIGCQPDHETEITVFVRDNGVGFDTQYADKLFGVFQRLHRATEFEGTGIGLANVRRVIARHGGRTWAEGKLDGGATFYFSLPQSRIDLASDRIDHA